MRELLLLLIRYKNFLIFVILELLFFGLYIQNNPYPQVVFSGKMIGFTGFLDQKMLRFYQFWTLPEENLRLLNENAQLKSEILYYQTLFEKNELKNEAILKNYEVIPARVMSNRLQQKTNFLTLNQGTQAGIAPQMGVINSEGIVGVVVAVSDHYALVRTILDQSKYPFSPMVYLPDLKTYGRISWPNQQDYTRILVKDVPYHLAPFIGMEVFSSDVSLLFPENILIGQVEQLFLDPSSNRFELQVKLKIDFEHLRYVYVVPHLGQKEFQNLEKNEQ